jgi:hypothetical protein
MIALPNLRSATVFAAGLLLAACAAEPRATPIAEPGGALPPPAASEGAPAGALSVAPSAPLPADAPAASAEPVIVEGPDGTSWEARRALDEAAYQDDIEDCYRYATAQTRRDARFIDDRNAGIDTLTNDSPYSGLRQRVDEFDLRNRRSALMSSCMESKGYVRADTTLPRLEF